MCMNPNYVVWNRALNKWMFPSKKNLKEYGADWSKTLFVPCGKCPECKAKWRTQLGQRMRWELEKYKGNCCFLTLTVNKENLQKVFPGYSLDHTYFQKFMKRLRRHLEYRGFTGKIKYLVCGEYGHDNGRPHFHAIIMGWRPDQEDLIFRGKTKKHYEKFESKLIQRLWSDPDATEKEIKKFNKDNPGIVYKNGGEYDYMPLGLVDVSLDVNENTAPYMVKYMVKFAEISKDEFTVNTKINDDEWILDNPVRKPYLVYPKVMIGLDYFLDHIDQIITNGFIMDSRGKYLGIPPCFIKYLKNSEDLEMQNYYLIHKYRSDEFIEEQKKILEVLCGSDWYVVQLEYLREQGRIRREMYESMKNNNR